MLLLACTASLPQAARAEGRRFEWQGPDCLTSAALFQSRLEKLVDAADLRRLAGRVGVTRQDERWIVEMAIELDGEHLGQRRFEAKSCEHAAETAAVAASLAVFDDRGQPENAPASSGPESAVRPAAPALDRTPELPPAKSAAPARFEARIGVFGVAELGVLPQVAPGAGVEAELAFTPRYSAALLGSLSTEQDRRVGQQQSVALRTFAALVRGCAAPARGWAYRVDGCAGLRFVMVRGRGDGFDVNRAASLLWVAPLLGFNLSLRAPSYLEWRLEFDASLPLSRRRFLVDDQEVARADFVVIGVRLGPVLRLP